MTTLKINAHKDMNVRVKTSEDNSFVLNKDQFVNILMGGAVGWKKVELELTDDAHDPSYDSFVYPPAKNEDTQD